MQTIEYDKVFAGYFIGDVLKDALAIANKEKARVKLSFNDTIVVVLPNEDLNNVLQRWSDDSQNLRAASLERHAAERHMLQAQETYAMACENYKQIAQDIERRNLVLESTKMRRLDL